jgi:PPK2 family polyphosphate:nucleotide phosphotransferase
MKTSAIRVEGKFKLSKIDANAVGPTAEKEPAKAELEALREQISAFQEKLYAEGKRSLLLVFQAMDTGGKDGAIRSVLSGINPAGVHVTSFKAPSDKELAHDFLWRIHRATPARGIIGVWNRSHYEDVLVTRVHKMIDDSTAKARMGDIAAFEEMLTRNGTTILKFFLYIDKDEQKERLQARLDDPDKHWKFSPGDLEERKSWDKYMSAFEDALAATSTKESPWYVVPANKKWARNNAIASVILDTLRTMDPQFPDVDFDPAAITIE